MFDISNFLGFLETNLGYTFILPTAKLRPELPYISVTPILSIRSKTYQTVKNKDNIDTVGKKINGKIYSVRRSQFSVTAISLLDTTGSVADNLAEGIITQVYSFLLSQELKDYTDENNLALLITSDIQPRYLIENDFNEMRYGFDIQINDNVVYDEDIAYIETLTISDKNNKIDDFNVEG